jgi:hypothetical protein
MGETDLHRDAMVRHIELLRHFFRNQRVYVSGDLLVYYEQGNPKKFVVPDTFVVKGVEPRTRRVYKIWVERKAPNVAIETTSAGTKKKDTIDKPAIYARLRVQEYFLFDPTQDYLDPPLQGHRLVGDHYEPIEPDESGALISEELALKLRFEAGKLELYRLDTGERLLERADEESLRAEREAERAEQESRRAEEEARRAEREAQRAEQEAAARRAAQEEAARLREELRRLSRP